MDTYDNKECNRGRSRQKKAYSNPKDLKTFIWILFLKERSQKWKISFLKSTSLAIQARVFPIGPWDPKLDHLNKLCIDLCLNNIFYTIFVIQRPKYMFQNIKEIVTESEWFMVGKDSSISRQKKAYDNLEDPKMVIFNPFPIRKEPKLAFLESTSHAIQARIFPIGPSDPKLIT